MNSVKEAHAVSFWLINFQFLSLVVVVVVVGLPTWVSLAEQVSSAHLLLLLFFSGSPFAFAPFPLPSLSPSSCVTNDFFKQIQRGQRQPQLECCFVEANCIFHLADGAKHF